MSESWSISDMETCQINSLLYSNQFYLAAIILHGLSSYAFFPVMFGLIWKRSEILHWHPNLLILLLLNAFSCLALASTTAWSATHFLIVHIKHSSDPCKLLWKTDNCSFIRAQYLFSFLLVSITHVGILIERVWATVYVRYYEKQGKLFGYIISSIAIVLSILVIAKVIENEDPNELITTCLTFSASKSVGNQIYIMFWVQLFLDGVVSVAHYALYKFNKKNEKSNPGSLSEQYQRRENVKTLKQIYPLLILSNITIGAYLFVISVLRLFKDNLPANWYEIIAALLFMMPHMPVMFSSLLIIELHRHKKRIARNAENIITNQDIPLHDQFHIPIQNWEPVYEVRNPETAETANGPVSSIWNCWNIKKRIRKHQPQVAVIS